MARSEARLLLARPTGGMRVAVELRHHSWAVDPVFDLLSRHHATYVVMSGAGLPCVLRATSTTVYVRLHGPDHDHLYAGLYGDADLYCGPTGSASGTDNTLASSPTAARPRPGRVALGWLVSVLLVMMCSRLYADNSKSCCRLERCR
jgi:hypothetical protein